MTILLHICGDLVVLVAAVHILSCCESLNDGGAGCAFYRANAVGTDVAMVYAKGTNYGRDECDKRILLHMPELAWH